MVAALIGCRRRRYGSDEDPPAPEVGKLVYNDPFAFLVGAALDQGIRWKKAWEIPYPIHRQGKLDAPALARTSLPELKGLAGGLPLRPRYWKKDGPKTLRTAAALAVPTEAAQMPECPLAEVCPRLTEGQDCRRPVRAVRFPADVPTGAPPARPPPETRIRRMSAAARITTGEQTTIPKAGDARGRSPGRPAARPRDREAPGEYLRAAPAGTAERNTKEDESASCDR